MARRESFVKIRLSATAAWEHLTRHGLSQNELARRLGVSSGYLSQLVNGQRHPSARMQKRLLELMPGVGYDDLFIVERRDADRLNPIGASEGPGSQNE